MGSKNDLDSRINQRYKSMSKGQKRLAAYITDHYDKAAFYTAARLGEAVGVSESTVVRFASNLGYKGYPGFQRAMEEQVRDRLSSVQKTDLVSFDAGQTEILEASLCRDMENIKETLEEMDKNAFELAADTILGAENIYIIGIRSCAPLAAFLAFYLNLILDKVHLLSTNSSSELFEQMLRIGKEDVMIGISFPRYSMRTLKAMEFANNRSARVITLTDSVHSPMNLYSSCNLVAKSGMSHMMDSLTAPFSVIQALLAALYAKRQGKAADTLELLEEIWEEYQVYGRDEIDTVDDFINIYDTGRAGEKT